VIQRSSLLSYGIYNQGKTLLMGQLADWVSRQGPYITRMYSADGGGDAPVLDKIRQVWTASGKDLSGGIKWLSSEINPKGVLDVLHMGDAPFRFEFFDQITRGWWPAPDGKMSPPTTDELGKVGARIYEGLTSYCERMNDTLAENIEDGKIKVDVNATSKFDRPAAYFKDGGSMIADIPPGLYKLIYQRIHKYVNQSQGLPGVTMWTAKELQVEDKDTKAKQFGPLLVGTKETPQAPGWFQHTLHLSTVAGAKLVTDAKGNRRQVPQTKYRIYLKQYFDADMPTVPYLCGLRLPATTSSDSVPGCIEDASEDGRPWSKGNPFVTIMPLIGLSTNQVKGEMK
jgi:hypothetical protein